MLDREAVTYFRGYNILGFSSPIKLAAFQAGGWADTSCETSLCRLRLFGF